MVSNSRYANLGEAPLKVMAQLRGLSPNGDKDSLVQRLVAQDIETSEPKDETPDSDLEATAITNGADDDEGWEVVGKKTPKRTATKREIRMSKDVEYLQDTSTTEDMEELQPVVGGEDEVAPVTVVGPEVDGDLRDSAPATEDVNSKGAEDTQEALTADITVVEVSKKKRRRGKKGGKKVNKNKASEDSDTAGKEAEEGSVEPGVAHDVDDAEAVGNASSTASTFVEDVSSAAPSDVEDNDAVDGETSSGSVKSGVTQDVVADHGGDDAESAVELSSTAPTLVEEPSSGIEKTDGVEDEPAEDIQTPSSPDVKLRQIKKEAHTVRASPNQFDVLSAEDDNVAKLEAINAAIDLAMDSTNDSAPKKSRKRGKKGGKKVQKAAAKKTLPKHFTHVACAAALFGVVGVAVVVSVIFA